MPSLDQLKKKLEVDTKKAAELEEKIKLIQEDKKVKVRISRSKSILRREMSGQVFVVLIVAIVFVGLFLKSCL